MIDILIAEGVRPFHFDMPIEVLERPTDGPVITENDILDLMILLERKDWFSQLQRAQAHPLT